VSPPAVDGANTCGALGERDQAVWATIGRLDSAG
jgi:hypothetical protein